MLFRSRKQVGTFLTQVRRTPFLRQRLGGVGALDSAGSGGMYGPIVRADGRPEDARAVDAAYQQLGFGPLVEHGADARARCWLRMAEIEQSLDLVLAASAEGATSLPIVSDASGVGYAIVETPRGTASMTATLADGQINSVEIRTPSSAHVSFVEHVAIGRELSNALVGVASLDLSPWELDR